MIKVSDLRGNNYVMSKAHNGLITQVHSLMPDKLRLWANPLALYDEKDVKGIALTPEILEIAGFQTTINNKDSGYKQVGISVKGHDFMFTIECNGIPEFYFDMVGTDIQYLHQLQNLYYALTGQELTINL